MAKPPPTNWRYFNPEDQTQPPTAYGDAVAWNPNFAAYGNSYIVWGTEGIAGYYIVTSASSSQRIEEIDIEQGAGFEAIVILLMKGYDVDIEVIDDNSIQPPSIYHNPYTLVTPFGTMSMLMVGNKSNQARKREGMRTFTFKSFTALPLGDGNTIGNV